eukprot:GHVQ01001557.1.p1 GENE.GHVQ01001557.1~~GHVQ01001557.1.p1  ORF type:complete len:134 (-),score=40.48 GHVQ01001557.1:171-572(-)
MIQQYIYTAASSVCTVIHISVLTHFVQIQTRGEETSSRLFYTSVSVCSSSFSCDLLTIILSLTHTYTHTDTHTHTPTKTHTQTNTDTRTHTTTEMSTDTPTQINPNTQQPHYSIIHTRPNTYNIFQPIYIHVH